MVNLIPSIKVSTSSAGARGYGLPPRTFLRFIAVFVIVYTIMPLGRHGAVLHTYYDLSKRGMRTEATVTFSSPGRLPSLHHHKFFAYRYEATDTRGPQKHYFGMFPGQREFKSTLAVWYDPAKPERSIPIPAEKGDFLRTQWAIVGTWGTALLVSLYVLFGRSKRKRKDFGL